MVARPGRVRPTAALILACLMAASCSSTAKRQAPAPAAGAGGEGALTVEVATWDFGSIKRGETTTRAVAIKNEGKDSLEVAAHSTCGCLTVEPEAQALGPGEEGTLLLSFLGEDIKEKATKTIYIEAGDAGAWRTRITVTGRVEPGEGPHLECRPSPMLFVAIDGVYEPTQLSVANRGRADLMVSDIRGFGCEASLKVFTLAGNEEVSIAISLQDGWTGNRWLEVVSNDPVQPTSKVSLVLTD